MDNGLNDKIRQMLSDPGAVEKIISAVNSMAPPAVKNETEPAEAPTQPDATPAAGPAGEIPAVNFNAAKSYEDSKIKLLSALKPLLRAEKQGKIDNLQRALTMASLFGNFNKK